MISLSSDVIVELAISVNDVIDTTMQTVAYVSGNVNTTTITIVGSIAVKKWDKVTVEMKTSHGSVVEVREESTWSTVFLGELKFGFIQILRNALGALIGSQ